MAVVAWLVGNMFSGDFMGTASLTPGKQGAVRPPLPLSLTLLFLLLVTLYSFLLRNQRSDDLIGGGFFIRRASFLDKRHL
jgi:NarL family two-component system sensor histidine kinase YdfH